MTVVCKRKKEKTTYEVPESITSGAGGVKDFKYRKRLGFIGKVEQINGGIDIPERISQVD